ncbi:MAG: hypothetical protein M3081_15105 [Gemmatimonadota bacterium]|nr:hypothetical protein [Gemmatimonadota bacterium]
MTDDRSEPPIDFSPLDPVVDAERFDAVVGAITVRAAAELARRRSHPRRAADALSVVAPWWREVVAAAAAIVALSVISLSRSSRAAPDTQPAVTIARDSVDEAVGVPPSLAPYLRSERLPSPAQLLELPEQQ